MAGSIVHENDERIMVDVRRCQRCGNDHNQMLFFPLANAVDDFNYYGTCQETNQPVLLAIRNTEGEL